jgi:hypothetical protein
MEISSTRTAPTQSTQQPTQLQKTKQTSEQEQGQKTETKPAETPPPEPVVNTQGQTTGRLLNTTA